MRYYSKAITSNDKTLVSDAKAVYDKMDASKKVTRFTFDVEEFTKFWRTLYAINALERNATAFQGIPLSDWNIPELFSDLVHPNAVLVDVKAWSVDFLQHYDLVKGTSSSTWEIFDKTGLDNFNEKLYAAFKVNAATVKLDQLRTDKLINTVYSRAVVATIKKSETANAEGEFEDIVTCYVRQDESAGLSYLPLTTEFMKNHEYSSDYQVALLEGLRMRIIDLKK